MRLSWHALFLLAVPTAACTGEAGPLQVCGDASVALGTGKVNLSTDPLNCGCVGSRCPPVAQADPTCVSGICSFSCRTGWADCDGNEANGCEVDLTSTENCGRCGNLCTVANGTPYCAGGACSVMRCESGFADCNQSVSDGCEINLRTSLGNCGMCRNLCIEPNASPVCAFGRCDYSRCDDGYGDCDPGLAACETNLLTNVDNCGGCGNACPRNNATPLCSAGACSLQCNLGWGDCNRMMNDGCESNLMASTSACGACGISCETRVQNTVTIACRSGRCDYDFCRPGFDNCDADRTNGCETDIRTIENCGGCGVRCSARVLNTDTPTCSAGVCGYSSACRSGYGDCDGVRSNGCERSLNDVANCGACNRFCSAAFASSTCSGGTCRINTCNTGWGDCNGSYADGCEVRLLSTNHCGACGRACSSGQACNRSAACVAGSCGNLEPLVSCDGFTCPANTTCSTTRSCNSISGYLNVRCDTGIACTGVADCPGSTWWAVTR
jgi:hypothetical protein